MKKAILIDSTNNEIREVEIGDDYREISKTIGCDLFTVVHIGGINDVYVDDEGLLTLTRDSRFFHLKPYPEPLAGNGLILGCNDEGESISTDLSIEDVRSRVTFLSLDDVRRKVLHL